MTCSKNNRKEQRVHLNGVLEMIIEDSGKKIQGDFLNINSRAMAFITKEKLQLDSNHFFSVLLPNLEKPLRNIKGHIIRQEDVDDGSIFLTVLSFISIPNVEMVAISKYIEENKA